MTYPARPSALGRQRAAFAALIVCVAMGIRHTFGLFLTPMSMEHQWSREVFSFALALQNLMWGATQPFAGFLADRYGARRVLWGASILYALGLLGMAYASTGSGLAASAGLLIGAAQSGCTYSVVFAAMGALVPATRAAGHGRGRRGRLLRPVPDDSGGIEPDRRHGLVRHPAGVRRRRAADHAAGRRADPRLVAAATKGQTGREALHEAARKGLPAAQPGLFRLRLPGGVHRRAFPHLPARQGPRPRGRHDLPGADRPVQRVRQLRRRPPRQPRPKRLLLSAIYAARSVSSRSSSGCR
jgi:hypothetical protein